MGPRKASLTAALADLPPAPEAPGRAGDALPPLERTSAHGAKHRSPARERKVNVAAWFPLAVKYGLQELALDRSRTLGKRVTLQDLMAEAFNDLFKKYGKAEAAPSGDG